MSHNATTERGTPTYSAGKFGNGLSAGVLVISGDVDSAIGTVELWMKSTAYSIGVCVGNSDSTWFGMDEASVAISLPMNGTVTAASIGSGGITGPGFGSLNLLDGAEHHLAAVWDTSLISIFADGICGIIIPRSSYSPNGMQWGATFGTSNGVCIGGFGISNSSYDFPGQLDEIRFSSVARYTSGTNFTPPTSAFSDADSNTIALFHLESDGTDSATSSVSATAYTLSASPSSVTDGTAVTITATLNGTSSNATVITPIDSLASTMSGTITITAGNITGMGTITPTVAGTHAITSSYAGGNASMTTGSTSFTSSASSDFTPGTITLTAGTPSSTCVAIAVGTAPTNTTGTVSYILETSYNGVDYYPLKQIVPGLPWVYDQANPNSTLHFRALAIDPSGVCAYTTVVNITTTATGGSSKTLVLVGINSQTAGDVGDLGEPTGHITGWNSNTSGSVASGATWAAYLSRELGEGFDVYNCGIDGQVITYTTALTNAYAALYTSEAYPGGCVAIILGVINNLRGGSTAIQAYGAYQSALNTLTTAGITRFVVGTEADVLDGSEYDEGTTVTSAVLRTEIAAFNASVRENWSSTRGVNGTGGMGALAVLDLGANGVIGAAGAASRASWEENYGYEGASSRRLHFTSNSNERIGRLASAAVAQAVSPPQVSGASTSTDPGVANVRHGTTYEINGSELTGTCYVPSASQVLATIAVDATTGNVILPTAGEVENTVTFGVSGSETGTYTGSGGGSAPTVQQIVAGLMAEPLSTAPAAGTVAEAFAAARAEALGSVVYNPTAGTFAIYAHDNATILKTFNVTSDGNGNVLGRA